jgi:hypothetical protein
MIAEKYDAAYLGIRLYIILCINVMVWKRVVLTPSTY